MQHFRLLLGSTAALILGINVLAGEADQQKIPELEKRVAVLEQTVLALQAQLAAVQAAQIPGAAQPNAAPPNQANDKKQEPVPVVYREAIISSPEGTRASRTDRDIQEAVLASGVHVLVERDAYIGATSYFQGYLSSYVFVLTGPSRGQNLWVHKDSLRETGVAKPRPTPQELLAEERAIVQGELDRILREKELALTIDKIEMDGALITSQSGATLRVPPTGRKHTVNWKKGDRLLLIQAGTSGGLFHVSLKKGPFQEKLEEKFLVDRCPFTDAAVKIYQEELSILSKLKEIDVQIKKP